MESLSTQGSWLSASSSTRWPACSGGTSIGLDIKPTYVGDTVTGANLCRDMAAPASGLPIAYAGIIKMMLLQWIPEWIESQQRAVQCFHWHRILALHAYHSLNCLPTSCTSMLT